MSSSAMLRYKTASPLLARSLYRPVGIMGARSFTQTVKVKNTVPANANTPQLAANLVPNAFKHGQLGSGSAASTEYLKAFRASELFLLFLIGCCTLNKPILDLCIKVFPYVPTFLIKKLIYNIYCGGDTVPQVIETGKRLATRGINNMMISLTIEACDGNDNVDPQFIVSETVKSVTDLAVPHTINMIKTSGKDINEIPPCYVALKPTGFAKNAAVVLEKYNTPEYAADFDELVAKAATVVKSIYESNVRLAAEYPERVSPFVVAVVDAEKHDLQEGVYELQRRLYAKFNKLDMPVSVVGTLQMYLSGSASLLTLEEKLAKEGNYRLGLKLVRGAYIHSEKERSTIIHKTKEDTDVNYNQGISYCITSVLGNKSNENTIGHLVVASHNAQSLETATQMVYNDTTASNKNKNNVVLGQLMGMADNITYNLIKEYGIGNVIKYVPWGPPLETKQYLLRRLEENGDAVRSDNGLPLITNVLKESSRRLFSSSA